MIPIVVRSFVVAVGASLLLAGPLAPQSRAPFSVLRIAGSGAMNVNRERLHELWEPGPAAVLRVSTPFYAGSVALMVQAERFRAREAAQPDFRAVTRAAEWNVEAPALGPLRGFAGILVGAVDMTFLDPASHTENVDENELVLGGQAGVGIPLARRVAGMVVASRRRVFTRVPLHLTYVSVGAEYRVSTPGWLKGVLE